MECQAEKPGCKHLVLTPNVDVPFSGSTCDVECAGQRDGFGLKMGTKNGEPLWFLKVLSNQVTRPGERQTLQLSPGALGSSAGGQDLVF